MQVDNRWVVPYNAFLSRMMDAHINVEIVGSLTVVKYLFKYVYKGHDRLLVRMGPATNIAQQGQNTGEVLNIRQPSHVPFPNNDTMFCTDR